MATADAIRAEIQQLNVSPVAPGLAAVAEALAEALDEAEAPAAKAVCARELSALMVRLRGLAPVESKGDAVDDIAEQRAKRRAATQQIVGG
ncbi:hypothetical protein GCM10010387_22450 [Streptomyces inusitatus]|uniref:Uncharacterized protein n=1 Tax=Streptomyces inusitatus TaxID=68221 RepID=A0A918Q2J0_9ACTN|nr:hypothetical protein [Streptomyces inusitatus]GGZ28495.1 hypothetical protein GCM10010387_22450 [Streptomyces inusitatus]